MSDPTDPHPDSLPLPPALRAHPPAGPALPKRAPTLLDAELEKEIEAAMSDLSDEALFGEPTRPSRRGPQTPQDRRRARVISVRREDVFLDLGAKSQGIIPMKQFEGTPPKPGDEIEVLVVRYDPTEGLLLLSLPMAAQQADWSNVAEGMIVDARVTAVNKGGLAVDVNGIRGFVPASQVDVVHVPDLEPLVGQKLRCVIAEARPSERNLVLSRRALLEREREELRKQTWEELAEGQIRTGVVRSVKDFGAFVDLGGVDGLVPVREMSWARVENPADLVQPGQQVTCVVLKVDRDARKISLGLKQLKPSPWQGVELKYPPPSVVPGKVTRVVDFGAFVELEPGVEGLIHISELATHRVRRAADVVQAGQEVQVRVLKVSEKDHKISLSLKAVAAAEVEEPEAADEPSPPPRPRPTKPLRGGLSSRDDPGPWLIGTQ